MDIGNELRIIEVEEEAIHAPPLEVEVDGRRQEQATRQEKPST